MAPATARTKRTTTNPRSGLQIRRMILLEVRLLTTLRLIPNEVLCFCRTLIHPSAWRDCPKRVGGACGVTLRSTSTVLFDPFWPPCASQIHAHSVALTPFRTVSEGTRVNEGKQ